MPRESGRPLLSAGTHSATGQGHDNHCHQPSISQTLSGRIEVSDGQLDRLLSCMGYRLEVTRRPVRPELTRSERRSWRLHRQLSQRLDRSRILGVKTDERAWRIGADGETEVARRLTRLGPGWKVLHAVPVGERGSDIDHVVIGPGGVFTINAKNHPQANVWVGGDTVKVNGFNQSYVRNSRHEARRAAKLLSVAAGFDVEVRGVVAIMGAHRGFTVKEQPRDGVVSVIARKQVDAHLQAMPAVLGIPSIERVFAVARHLATWCPTTVRWDDFDTA